MAWSGAAATGSEGAPAGSRGSGQAASGPQPRVIPGLPRAASGGNGTAGWGYDLPAIPEIMIPDFSIVDAATQRYLTQLGDLVRPVKGVTVAQARCDGTSVVTRAGINFENDGDGSGNYYDTKNGIQVDIDGDGSGNYYDTVNGIQIDNDGDGSGNYYDTKNGIQIDNDGDGSGVFYDTRNGIQADLEMDPLSRIPTIGTIPPIDDLAPLGTACGTLIRLEDRVLFDFDKATLRPEAGPVLDKVAAALRAVEATLQVNGHTDSIGSDAYNEDLSSRRAKAVADALGQRGVDADLEVSGFGEKQPIAKNSINGADNPGGRQLNRRVEIVIPN